MSTKPVAPAEAGNLPEDVQKSYNDYVEAATAHVEALNAEDALKEKYGKAQKTTHEKARQEAGKLFAFCIAAEAAGEDIGRPPLSGPT